MIENGTIVNVHYTGKLTDGSVFDSSEGRGALRFEIGSGQIIPDISGSSPLFIFSETEDGMFLLLILPSLNS